MVWQPAPSQAAYYSLPSPSSTHSLLSQLFHRPPYPDDHTWGRDALPRLPEEEEIRSKYRHRDGRVYLDDERTRWVSYQVWEPRQGVESKGAWFLESAWVCREG